MPARPRPTDLRKLLDLGIKYGPLAYEGVRRGKQPAQEMAQRHVARRNARSIALEHASHLVDGSILPVYDGDLRVWVVFSGDHPVATHPVVRTPTEQLLQHYDLAKRQRPEDVEADRNRRLRRLKGRRTP